MISECIKTVTKALWLRIPLRKNSVLLFSFFNIFCVRKRLLPLTTNNGVSFALKKVGCAIFVILNQKK